MAVPNFNIVLALIGGALLALMIKLNSALAFFTSPVTASWTAHLVGTIIALLLMAIVSKTIQPKAVNINQGTTNVSAPLWSYFGGIPGALVVMLAAVTVNSELGLAGTLVLGLLGQVCFGLTCDYFGLFGVMKKELKREQLFTILPILAGSFLIIFFRGTV